MKKRNHILMGLTSVLAVVDGYFLGYTIENSKTIIIVVAAAACALILIALFASHRVAFLDGRLDALKWVKEHLSGSE